MDPQVIETLGNIGEFVGSIGVLLSLVYLALQIRKSTATERTSTYQAAVSAFADLSLTVASTEGLSDLFVRGMEEFDDLTPEEKSRIAQIIFSCFHHFENMYYQYKKGYLEDEVWMGWKRLMLTYFKRPGVQVWWKARRGVYSESFANFLETETLDYEVPSYFDITQISYSTDNREDA